MSNVQRGVQCVVFSLQCSVCSVFILQCAVCSVFVLQCAVCSVFVLQCSVCSVFILQCAVCSVFVLQCAVCIVFVLQCAVLWREPVSRVRHVLERPTGYPYFTHGHSSLCNEHFILNCTLHIKHFTLNTSPCTLCT